MGQNRGLKFKYYFSDLKKDVLLESEKVQIAREKLEKILVR